MGTNDVRSFPNERPAHRVRVEGFWIDEHDVTNAEFTKFVEATGYVTTAETKPNWEELKKQLPAGTPKPDDSVLVAGSLVFTPTPRPVPLNDLSAWWRWVPGACWRHPEGPDSDIAGSETHPVVQVSWDDAVAGQQEHGARKEFIYFNDDADLVGLRVENWKIVFEEQRAPGTLLVWMEPFTKLRLPKIFDLHSDPYERADITSNSYYEWELGNNAAMAVGPAVVSKFLATFKEYPPSQRPSSFTIDQIVEKMQRSFSAQSQ